MQFSAPKLVATNTSERGGPYAAFDFDDTLTVPYYDEDKKYWIYSDTLRTYTALEMIRLHLEGWRIVVITDRQSNDYNKRIVTDFLTKNELPYDGIIFTSGEEKATFLQAINAKVLYDDDKFEIHALVNTGITGILVPHPSDSNSSST